MRATLINVSNRLPITVAEDDSIKQSSGGLVAALEGLPSEQYRPLWIGWPGGEIPPQKQPQITEQLQRQFSATPVYLTADQMHGFYEGLSNSSIWPLLHYAPLHHRYEPKWWEDYREVNQMFAEQVLSVAQDGDLVWVHDYQLMLLPAMLKEARPSLRVGFFLHTPFPSYEVFRCHPNREELVAGMLGADQIGFHTFNYMRHFRSSVLRLLGIESEISRIRRAGHTSHLGVYPIGINASRFEQELGCDDFRRQMAQFRETFGNKRIILSVERVDYTKGILRRLNAIDLFLRDWPARDLIKFIFVSIPSREGVEEYRELREEIEYRIGRINGEYTTLHNAPVHFIHGSVNFTELAALYAIAEVCLVTPLVDGMNLVAKEYVAAQRDNPGVLVLSEFAGAAEELLGAVIVNPYHINQVADAIAQALHMPPEERQRRMEPMRQRVMRFDAVTWAKTFIDDLQSRDIEHSAASTNVEAAVSALRSAVAARRKLAMFLDYDGTLREIERDPAAARPNPAVNDLLDRLGRHDHIDVTIISGRTPQDLESFVGRYSFGLIAEHGASVRPPHQRQWEQLDSNISLAWMEELLKVLRAYEASTPGSFVETKRTGLVWHYRRTEPEFGAWKAKQLAEELASMTANQPLHVRHGRKIIEITPMSINKGAAIQRILAERKYDQVLIAGDDQTDESMFRLSIENVITIKVGEGDTVAEHRLPTPDAFRRFLLRSLP